MKMMFAALALAIAIPGVAHAQTAPTPAPTQAKKKCCCEKMGMKMDCCDEHGKGKPGSGEHAGHDMSQHQQPNQ
ncbi:MAG TPA: hypothetical protein VFP12_10285 [Allosphingosinicella sp.]|nr:hypothetical protein [Allosphingosinicella sp.]